MKSQKQIFLFGVLCGLLILTLLGCITGDSNSDNDTQSIRKSDIMALDFTYVAEARYNGFGVVKLVTIGPSEALYILSSNGTVTPYYDANGRHMTVASLEQNLE